MKKRYIYFAMTIIFSIFTTLYISSPSQAAGNEHTPINTVAKGKEESKEDTQPHLRTITINHHHVTLLSTNNTQDNHEYIINIDGNEVCELRIGSLEDQVEYISGILCETDVDFDKGVASCSSSSSSSSSASTVQTDENYDTNTIRQMTVDGHEIKIAALAFSDLEYIIEIDGHEVFQPRDHNLHQQVQDMFLCISIQIDKPSESIKETPDIRAANKLITQQISRYGIRTTRSIKDLDLELAIYASSSIRSKIIASGFLNQFQTHQGTYGFNPGRRESVEATCLGVSIEEYKKIPYEIRPKYGMLLSSKKLHKNISKTFFKSAYGDDIYLLHLYRIERRLTWTPCDSFGAKTFIPWICDPAVSKGSSPSHYKEFQVWGPLKISDVKAMIFTQNKPSRSTLATLRANHVQVFDGTKFPIRKYEPEKEFTRVPSSSRHFSSSSKFDGTNSPINNYAPKVEFTSSSKKSKSKKGALSKIHSVIKSLTK